MAITSAGIGSGIDVESIISGFIQAEKTPKENSFNQTELRLNAELSGVGTLKSELSKFQDVLKKLTQDNPFSNRTAKIDIDENSKPMFDVITSNSVSAGEFEVEIVQKAQAHRLQSVAQADSNSVIGSGNLTFNVGNPSTGVSVETFNIAIQATDTLSDIRDLINSSPTNSSVSANIINTDAGAVLTLQSINTGVDNQIKIVSDDDSLSGIATEIPLGVGGVNVSQQAMNGQLAVNGLTVSSNSDKFGDVISGANITLTSDSKVGDKQKIIIANDRENSKATINEFIDGYNSLLSELDSLANTKSGNLASDSIVRQIKGQLIDSVFDEVTSATGSLTALYDIGISLGGDNKLEISQSNSVSGAITGQERFDAAIENNYNEIESLFTSSNGVAERLDQMIEVYVKSGGVLADRTANINESIDSLELQRTRLSERLASYESTLRAQFLAMDQIISQFNASSSALNNIPNLFDSDT